MQRETGSGASVSDVAFAMSTHDLAIEQFLDRSTGEVTVVFESDDSEEGNALRDAIDRDPDRFVRIPRSEAREDYARIERFVDELDDPAAIDQLRDALAGKGAFSRFRSAVERSNVRERWFAFEARDRERLAREWLASIDFPVDEKAPPPSPPEPPRKAAVTPLRIAHVLLIGAPDGKTEIIGGRVRRFIDGRSDVTVDDMTVTLERNGVSVDIVVPPEIVARFSDEA